MLYRILGIVVLLAFYGCYFIKMLLQKRKGIITDQIGKGKAGCEKAIEIAMKIAAYLTPIAEIISIILGASAMPNALRLLAAGIGTIGVAVFIISVVTMRDNWRAGIAGKDRTSLVTDGIYKISRNPAFVGFDLVYIGILLMFFNWILLFISVFAMIMLHVQIVMVEEPFLLSAFGKEYAEYKNRVCRYIGKR